MKNILITGGTGFIGKYIVELLSKNNDVSVITRKKNLSDEQIKYHHTNLLNYEELEKITKEKDIVVHAGAAVIDLKKNIYKTNVLGTKNIVRACKKNNIKKFIFLSSDVVLQKRKNYYAISKVLAEKIVKELKNTCILRPTLVYGKNDEKNLGKVIMLLKRLPFIPIPGNGKNKIQPIHVEDVAAYVNNAIKHDVKGSYILAGTDAVTFNEFIDKVCYLLKINRFKVYLPLKLLLPFAKIFELIPYFNISASQIKNMKIDKTHDISNTIKKLRHVPMSLDEGLRKTLL